MYISIGVGTCDTWSQIVVVTSCVIDKQILMFTCRDRRTPETKNDLIEATERWRKDPNELINQTDMLTIYS